MASKAIGFLNFKFAADLKPFERAMNKAQKKLKRFGKSVQKTGKSLTTSLTLPIAALGVASVKAFDKQQKAIAQVEAGLKSTAGTVGFTSKELQKMAADLQKTTLFGDEEILQGATAQLLTFTNITGKEFERTQKIALDLATRLDGDLKSASIMLGKALNDPVANLSALSRAGIQFSDDQKAVVKSLVETGQLAEAQTIILAELEKQYGGSAAAAAEAGLGPIQQLKNQLSDLSEQIGERLLPFVKQFVDWLVKMAEKFDGLSESTKDNIVKWGLLLAALGPTLIMIGKIATGISALIPIIRALTVAINSNPWMLLVAAIVAAGFALAEYAMEATALEQSQKSLNEIQLDAIANAKNQERILLKQLEIARDVTKSDDLRKKAIGELNKTLGNSVERLNLKNIAEVNVTNAINEHTAAMIKQAKIAGVQNLISKNFEEMTKLAQDGTRALKGFWTISGQLQRKKLEIGGLIDLVKGDKNRAMGKQITEQIINGAQSELQNNQNFLENLLNDLVGDDESLIAKTITPNLAPTSITPIGDLGDDGNGSKKNPFEVDLENLEKNNKKALNVIKGSLINKEITQQEFNQKEKENTLKNLEDLKAIYESYGKSTIDIDEKILNHKLQNQDQQFSLVEDQFKNVFFWQQELTDAQKLLNGGVELFGDILTNSLNSALDSQENFFQVFVKNIKKAIRQLLIQLAVMTLIKALMGGGAAAFSLTSLKANLGEIMNVQLKDGGLITGPTTALVGEGLGTSASNPEVVAPLDKLKSMIGGGTQNVVVEGRLAGNDIFLSNARTKFNRNRTV